MSEPDRANLMGMELKAAREYVLAHVATLKTTQLAVKRIEEELNLWRSRVKLATEKNRPDLQSAAQAKVTELEEKLSALKGEEKQLSDDIARMKIQLKAIEHQPSFTVDAELLNARMEQVVGEQAATNEQFRSTEADRALEELKKKLDPNYVTSWERAAAEKAAARAAEETAAKTAAQAGGTPRQDDESPQDAPDAATERTVGDTPHGEPSASGTPSNSSTDETGNQASRPESEEETEKS